MKTLTVTVAITTCACLFGAIAVQQASSAPNLQSVVLVGRIRAAQAEVLRWQRVMGPVNRPTRGLATAKPVPGRRALTFWTRLAHRFRWRAQHPPHLYDWLCIHRYEADWTAATGNGYYGGLQMDVGFQRTYGAHLLLLKGTADHWTPLEQIWVAETARRTGRGFYPWPNTARVCGLI